jgi:hypothetical protein
MFTTAGFNVNRLKMFIIDDGFYFKIATWNEADADVKQHQ